MCGSICCAKHDKQPKGDPQQQPAQQNRCLDAVAQRLDIARLTQFLGVGEVAVAADAAERPLMT